MPNVGCRLWQFNGLLMQLSLKFESLAHHTGHLILTPIGYTDYPCIRWFELNIWFLCNVFCLLFWNCTVSWEMKSLFLPHVIHVFIPSYLLFVSFLAWLFTTVLLVGWSWDRFPVVSLGIFSMSPTPMEPCTLRSTQPLKVITRDFSWGKAAGAYGWWPTTIVVPNVKIIGGLNLPGTPWATSACCGMTFIYQKTECCLLI